VILLAYPEINVFVNYYNDLIVVYPNDNPILTWSNETTTRFFLTALVLWELQNYRIYDAGFQTDLFLKLKILSFYAENVCIHNNNIWQKGEQHAGKCVLANIS